MVTRALLKLLYLFVDKHKNGVVQGCAYSLEERVELETKLKKKMGEWKPPMTADDVKYKWIPINGTSALIFAVAVRARPLWTFSELVTFVFDASTGTLETADVPWNTFIHNFVNKAIS
jgi:hypothetical protein